MYTGIGGGRNLGITAGVDIGAFAYHGFLPALEVRGTEPIDDGQIDSQKNAMGGLKVERRYRNVHPYANILFGRGEITFSGIGYLNSQGTLYITETPFNVISPGGGVDIDVASSFAVKGDFQYEHFNVTDTTSGTSYTKAITIGVVYRFGYNQRHPD